MLPWPFCASVAPAETLCPRLPEPGACTAPERALPARTRGGAEGAGRRPQQWLR